MNRPARDCGALAAASAARSGFRTPVESTGLQKPEMGLRELRGALRMVFSHFRGGLEPPCVAACSPRQWRRKAASTGRGGFTLNGCTVDAFTVNGFTVNRFTPPVDALRHGRSPKPFRICSCEKCVRNSPGMCSYKSKDLNSPGINSYRKSRVGGLPLPATAVTRKWSR